MVECKTVKLEIKIRKIFEGELNEEPKQETKSTVRLL